MQPDNSSTSGVSFSSDFTWKVIPVEQKDWHKTEFDSKDWIIPDTVIYSEAILDDSIFTNNNSLPIWTHYDEKFEAVKYVPEKTAEEKLLEEEEAEFEDEELTEEELALKNKHIFYFRKEFDLDNLPLSGNVTFAVDDRFGFLVNGKSQFDMILKEDVDDFELTFDDTLGWNKARQWDVSEALNEGKNSLVVYALDMDEVANGLTCFFDIKMLNSSITRETNLSLDSNDGEEDSLEEKLEKTLIRIFKKNRIE